MSCQVNVFKYLNSDSDFQIQVMDKQFLNLGKKLKNLSDLMETLESCILRWYIRIVYQYQNQIIVDYRV